MQEKKSEEAVRKIEEQSREDVVWWRKECAIMKRKINLAKNQSWNDFLQIMDYRRNGPQAYRLMDTLNDKKEQRSNHVQ
ncbi:hypothetical protein NPIL_453131 [Nephila pilipes]|uniref:Uncharacterized protein n=1 Tax=Nephila pilipes TaxID=299642 RepID=A0A8X6NZE7_NEPPI|nr:hypothetical protein NPIL_453131 [Nephila pilipes]